MKCLISAILIIAVYAAKAENILVIGDSHSCGPFGANIVESLTKQGNNVSLYCAVSSAPANWLQGKNPPGQICQSMTSQTKRLSPCSGNGKVPKLTELLNQNRNSKVISALGTNSLLSSTADSSYRQMAQTIKSSDHSCLWVGPPHLKPSQSRGFPSGRVAALEANLSSFYESLSRSVDGYCVLLDSRSATEPGQVGNQTVDGVHRNAAAGKSWANFVASPKVEPTNQANPSAR